MVYSRSMLPLEQFCGDAALNFPLSKLEAQCMSLRTAWGPSTTKIILTIVAALLVAVVVLVVRLAEKKPDGERNGALAVVLYTFEGLVYGALGAWAGASAGLTLALLLHPIVMGVGLIAFAVIAIVLMIYALVRGNAGAGGKVVAVLCFLSALSILEHLLGSANDPGQILRINIEIDATHRFMQSHHGDDQ